MASKETKKRYRCINYGVCTKADNNEILEFDIAETISGKPKCPCCGGDTLEEIVETPPTWLKYAIIAGSVAAVAALGAGGYFMLAGSGDSHSANIQSIVAEGWDITPSEFSTLNDGDTIWFSPQGGTDEWKSVKPTITLEDPTAKLEPKSAAVQTKKTITVTADEGAIKKSYVLVVNRPVAEATHSANIKSIVAEGYTVQPEDLSTLADGATITLTANPGTDTSKGVTPTIALEDPTAVISPSTFVLKDKQTITVSADKVDSKTYVLKLKKPADTGGGGGPVSLSYGKYSGESKNGYPHGQGRLTYTKARQINKYDTKKRMAAPGDYVMGEFVNGYFINGKHFNANGDLIETLMIGITANPGYDDK